MLGLIGRLSLGRSLRLALIVLTLALAAIAAVGVSNLYSVRQHYEDQLARSYELESASSRLLALGVIEEIALRERGSGSARMRRRARASFDVQAARTRALAGSDQQSVRLVALRLAAERRARGLAAKIERGRSSGGDELGLADAIRAARGISEDLSARQRERRSDARAAAGRDTRAAVVTAAGAGALALIAALALVGGLVASIRRPLDDLVDAAGRLAAGDLDQRVDSRGPDELRSLGRAFNQMAMQLGGARERIDAERRKLAVTVESLGDALVVCDPEGRVTSANRRAGQLLPELPAGADAAAADVLPDLDEALAGEVVLERDGRTLSVTAARLGDQDAGVVWTARDISERARVERMKSDFVATASHELRSPLTSIKGFVELLGHSEGLGEREREFVEVILQSTDRLVDLVDDLLDVARLETGKVEMHPRLFDLTDLVREVATLMRPRVEARHQALELQLPPGLPRTLADPSRVRQIVTNLMSNAHQYTTDGGRVGVSVSAVDGLVELAVSDDGRGMDAEELERVFDRFARRDDAGTGTGLGLAIVKSLVDAHRGTIEVESEPGRGSTFTVRLPAGPSVEGGAAPHRAIRGKRVLVVDDDPSATQLVASQLAGFDVATEVVHDGDSALDRLREGGVDAITLDIVMPGRSGLEVLRAMRGEPRLARTPVVVVSVVPSGEALAGEWHVTKPIDAAELADTLGWAVLTGRTRVLVVGRSALRERLEPALVGLGLDHEWVTSAPAAVRACDARRYEVALVDAGMRGPEAALDALDLRGRRTEHSVLLVSAGDDAPGVAKLGPRIVALEDAAAAVMEALSQGD